MNRELFIVFLFLVFLFILNRNKEGMVNPLVKPEYEFAILTSPQEVMSGYDQGGLCRNDSDWKSGDIKCQHILDKEDCILEGDNGVLANDACLVACDTCPSSVKIKKRQDVGTDLSVRGINLEDNDEFDYLEIYDKIDRANSDMYIITDTFDHIKKYNNNYLDVAAVCKRCFSDGSKTVEDIINFTIGGSYLPQCPEECRKFANCNLSTNEDECEEISLTQTQSSTSSTEPSSSTSSTEPSSSSMSTT